MKAIRRTNTGCWTCRARKKKCDEDGLPCSTCKSLRLPCHGYGARPDWKDGSVREVARLAAFKSTVQRAKARSRPCTLPQHASLLLDSADPGMAQDILEESCAWRTGLSTEHGLPSHRTRRSMAAISNASETQRASTRHDPHRPEGPRMLHVTSYDIVASDTILHHPNACIESPADSPDFSSFVMDFAWPLDMTEPDQTLQDLPAEPLDDDPSIATMLPTPAAEEQTPDLTWEEQQRWRHYTEVQLPSLFPFMSPALAQEECANAVDICRNSVSCLRQILSQTTQSQASELKRFGLCADSGSEPEAVGAATEPASCSRDCLLHNLTAQINTGGNNWPAMIDRLVVGAKSELSHRQTLSTPTPTPEPPFEEEILCLLEVLASTVTGRQPELITRHVASTGTNHAESNTGVEAWLLACIARTVELQQWKTDQHAKGCLSTRELTRRALSIDISLRQNRACSPLHCADSARSAFMDVWLSATAVLLECVVSGARPDVPEIKRAVAAAATALKNVPQVALLKRLAWPVCVAASMTRDPELQGFFRTLHARLALVWGADENVCRALLAAFECWRLRDSRPDAGPYDWVDGMKSLGGLWLLF